MPDAVGSTLFHRLRRGFSPPAFALLALVGSLFGVAVATSRPVWGLQLVVDDLFTAYQASSPRDQFWSPKSRPKIAPKA